VIRTVVLLLAIFAVFGLPDGNGAGGSDAPAMIHRLVLPALAMDGVPVPATYVVQPGDNLYAIALRYGTTSAALVALNHLTNPNAIAPGQTLVVFRDGPLPAPIAGPAPAAMVFHGDTSRPMVAFSFDAGSDAGYTSMILDTLARNHIRASFGMTGLWAVANPALLQRIVQEGHQLINHSYDHPDFTTISTAARQDEVDSTDSVIQSIAGIGTKPFFRSPFGAYNAGVNSDLAAFGYNYNIWWTVDSLGWNGLSVSQILDRCLSHSSPGAIYLFHVGSQSQDGPALQMLIDGLRAQGYSIGSVADVMGW
jgi:peptidoglycan/xylan/chitin deacetylase (PgdA/CDA1 family)